MKNESISRFVLVLEIAAIIFLHSLKSASGPTNIVKGYKTSENNLKQKNAVALVRMK